MLFAVFFFIRLMLIYFGGADFLIVFSLKCDGFNNVFFGICLIFFKGVEDIFLEPILETQKRNSWQKNWVLRPPL